MLLKHAKQLFSSPANVLLVMMLLPYLCMEAQQIQRFHALLDKYPLSAYELPPTLDLEILEEGFVVLSAAPVAILKVRPAPIGPGHFRDPATLTQLQYEPGGWIEDDVPVKKAESVHPKGIQLSVPGAEADPSGGTRLRNELKSWATKEHLSRVRPTSDRKGDKEG